MVAAYKTPAQETGYGRVGSNESYVHNIWNEM